MILMASILLSSNMFAQKFTIEGNIRDAQTGEPLFMATVVLRESGQWSTSDEKGHFVINGVANGRYSFEASMLGYETYKEEISVANKNIKKEFVLNVSSLSLQEVVVIAKEGGEINSSSKIEKQTLEHIQPSSLTDVMQLLPGSVTVNPTLTTVNSLSIRDIGNNSANIAGTALIVDGASVSNDANMQVLDNGTVMNSTTSNVASTAGSSVDTRQISTDNIESVEIIRGIPSAEYGNMTSGAVIVKTKAGVTPWEFRIKADPSLKQVYAGKGFSLGEKKGVMNFDMDYALAYSDIRSTAEAYDRINFQAGYSNNFKEKLTFNMKLRANYSKASTKSDPDLFLEELFEQLDEGLNLNINGKWILNKSWITNIDYVFSGSYAKQYSRAKDYVAQGRIPGTGIMEEGEHTGFFTPYQYYSDVEIFGNPVNAQAKITASQFGRYGDVTNKIIAGLEYDVQGNVGNGKVFDVTLPPSPGTSSYRERSYKDVPFVHNYTAFAEDRFKYFFGEQHVEFQAGVRFSGIYADKIENLKNFASIEPRFNAKYEILNRKEGFFRQLSARAGWGNSYKMPSMIYLYPEDAYDDVVSFSYNDIDANNYGLTVITTQKVSTINSDLKLQKSVNFETGVDFDTEWGGGSVVYYNEKLTNGYGFATRYTPLIYSRYGYSWNNGVPTQAIIASGKKPVYDNGAVYVDGEALPSISDTTFMRYSIPVNGITNNKWGVEFTFDFPKIKAINTSINVSGAYMKMESLNGEEQYYLYGSTVNGRSFPYIGIYSGSATSSNSRVREKFSTNVRFITHIPKISMVVTVTAQMVFMDNTTNRNIIDGNSNVYYYEGTARVSGQAAADDKTHIKRVNPLYIMDRSGNISAFTREMENDPEYEDLIITTNTSTYYIKSGYPFYGLLNIRVSKEIKKIATVSFYANNFLNLRGRVRNTITNYAQDKNSKIYFGAEVKFTIK